MVVKKNLIASVSLLFLFLIYLTACSVKPLTPDVSLNYRVINNNTKIANIIEQHLGQISNPDGEVLTVELSRERMTKRTFSVDEKGQPNRYLNELQVHLRITKGGETLANEYLTSSQESLQNRSLSSGSDTQQLVGIMADLSHSVFDRINEIINSKKATLSP